MPCLVINIYQALSGLNVMLVEWSVSGAVCMRLLGTFETHAQVYHLTKQSGRRSQELNSRHYSVPIFLLKGHTKFNPYWSNYVEGVLEHKWTDRQTGRQTDCKLYIDRQLD